MKKVVLIFAVVAFMSCGSNEKSSKSSDSTATESVSDKPAAPAEPSSPWTYKSETDKMTSKEKYYAVVNATNTLNFEFPYAGGSTATITVRQQDNSNDVILSIDKGQFLGGDDHNVNVKFDNDAPISFASGEPSDGSSDVLFIEYPAKLIKRLKTAKKMIVQAEFYESGTKEMEFDVAGFKWDH